MDISLKIGIVLNYKNAEKKKDELFEINSKDYLSSEKIDNELIILRKGKKCVPADVAIGCYIKHKYSDDPNFKIENQFVKEGGHEYLLTEEQKDFLEKKRIELGEKEIIY